MKDLGAKVECDLRLVVFGENFTGIVKDFTLIIPPNRAGAKNKYIYNYYLFGSKNKYKLTMILGRNNEKKKKGRKRRNSSK